jgi:protein-S-isoprenylcysteine O-methyltransferase Ste14
MLPGLYGVASPGLGRYDELLGVQRLPWPVGTRPAGLVLLIGGVALMIASNRALLGKGRGAAAFLLTEQVVSEGIYAFCRNPMSLGFYMACVGVGLVAGSTAVTVGALLIIVPVHMLNLHYFEERELALRFGQPYLAYRTRTPFLIPRLGRRRRGA